MAIHLERGSVNLEARGRNLRDVLDELFLQMGAKYDLPPEVQGTVTIDFHNATYAQALDLLLGSEFTYSIGPHDIIYIHRGGTSWRPGGEESAA